MMELWKSLFPHLGPDSMTSKLAAGDEDTFNQIGVEMSRHASVGSEKPMTPKMSRAMSGEDDDVFGGLPWCC
jgi:hypothetical protein